MILVNTLALSTKILSEIYPSKQKIKSSDRNDFQMPNKVPYIRTTNQTILLKVFCLLKTFLHCPIIYIKFGSDFVSAIVRARRTRFKLCRKLTHLNIHARCLTGNFTLTYKTSQWNLMIKS